MWTVMWYNERDMMVGKQVFQSLSEALDFIRINRFFNVRILNKRH